MKFTQWVAIFAVVGALVGSAGAQTQEDRIGVPVTFYASANGRAAIGEMLSFWASSSGYIPKSPTDSTGSWFGAYQEVFQYSGGNQTLSTSGDTVRLIPGNVYLVNVGAYGDGGVVNWTQLHVIAPIGYALEIDHQRRSLLQTSGSEHNYVVRLVATSPIVIGRSGGPAGLSGSLSDGVTRPGSHVQVGWNVGLGSRRNGESAGSLSITDSGHASTWAAMFTPAALSYNLLPDEILLYRVSNAIRQVVAHEAVVDVVTINSTSYEVRFYRPANASTSGWPRTFTGSPFITYKIEQGATSTALKITSSTSARTAVTSLERSGSWPAFTWTTKDWNTSGETQLAEQIRQSTSGSADRNEQVIVRVPGGATAIETKNGYTFYSWGEELTSSTLGTTNPLTTTYAYYDTPSTPANHRNLKSVVFPGGRWEAYEYWDSTGQPGRLGALKYRYRPWNNAPTTVGFNASQGDVTYFEYGADPFGMHTRPTLVETKVNNVPVAKSTTSYSAVSGTTNGMNLVQAVNTSYTASASSLTTTTRFYREDVADTFWRGQVHSVLSPSGVKMSYVRQRGTWSGSTFTKSGSNGVGSGSASRIAVITGTTLSSGNTLYQTCDGYDIEDLYLVANKSTMEVTLRDAQALVVRTETYVWTGSAWSTSPVAYEDFVYDANGRLEYRQASNGAIHSYTWSGEQKQTETDATGVKLTYSYDAAGRVGYVEKESGGPLAHPQRTTITYNAAGLVLTEKFSAPSGTSETIETTRAYDDASRPTSIDPPSSKLGATTFSYDPANRRRTTTAPDTGTTVEETQIDGRLKSITGNAVVAQHYSYGVETDGRRFTQVNAGTSSSPRWTKSWVDWLGRPIKTERPGFSQGSPAQPNFVEEMFYDDVTVGAGRLFKATRTGYALMRYEYDALGRVVRSGLDIGNNGLVLASADRIGDSDTVFELISGAWWLKMTAKIYPTVNSSISVTTSVSRTRLTGFTGTVQAESKVTDGEGNETTTTVSVTRSTKTVTSSTTRSGISNAATSTVVNGLADSSIGHDGLVAEIEYDILGRPWKSVDTRNKETITAYYSGTALPFTVTDPASIIIQTNDYDTSGRLAWSQNAEGHKVRYAYNLRGQVTHQWGAGAYPLAFGYHSDYAERTSLSTYRGGSNWDSSTWPAGTAGTADTTEWTYDSASGLLWKKTDAANKFVSYNYNSRGQVSVRTWARAVTTTYSYDNDTGELMGQDYSDTTPDVTFAYTRLGQLASAIDHTGAWDYRYDASKPWRQASAALPAFYGTRYWSPLYESSGFVGSYRGFQLGSSANPNPNSNSELEQTLGFSGTTARLMSLTSGRAGNTVSRTFNYAYETNAPWVSAISLSGSHPFTVTRTYEADRPLLASIETKWSTTSAVKFAYTHNDRGQRRVAVQSGSAFADYYVSGSYSAISRHFTYNTRGELETEAFYRGEVTGTPSSGDALPGRRDEFRYDSIGNRKTSGQTGSANTADDEYTANALNQYTERENNLVPFRGTTPTTGTTVAISGVTVNQLDRVWAGDLEPANTTQAVKGSVTINTTSPTSSENRGYFALKRWQTFGYDDDGNVTHDSEWDYTWDAENRLVLMEHRSEVVGTGMLANADKRRIEFRYDYQSRRVRKTVFGGWNGTSFNAIPLSDTKYLYDGWNLVAEFSVGGEGALTLARSYTWGLDLIGSLTASGGVGALLQIHDHAASKTLLPAYDGNGNVVALLNDTSGDLEAVYDYSPFGKLVRSTGTYAEANAFRFSTKFTDSETGLVYYGLRYYSPTLGRFLGRDPIEESGGLNLYGFVRNNAVNGWDYLGMDPIYEYGSGGVPFEVLNYDQVWASVWYGVSPTNQNWSVGDNLLAARLGEQRGQMENYDRGTGFDANGPMFGQTSFFSDDKYVPVISHAEATFRWGNSVSGGDQLVIDSRNDTILSINGRTQGGTVTIGPMLIIAPNSGDVASGRLSTPYLGVPASAVPAGQVSYFAGNLDPGSAASVIQQTKDAVAHLRANSPTFEAAYQSRLSWSYGVSIVPVPNTGGGTVNVASNIVFGTLSGVRPDGSVVYPAYTIAHEFGHTYQVFDRNNPGWQVNSNSMTAAQRATAPNSAEYYAYHFAEQVAREVRQNSGVNIGAQANYRDVGSQSQDRGIWPPPRN